MVYFYVDDGLNGNGKAREAGPAPMGLWVMSGSYSGQHLTEGFVPHWYVRTFTNGMKLAASLVGARLWHAPGERCKSDKCPAKKRPVPEGQFAFHDWAKINTQTKAVIEKKRAETNERVRAHRERVTQRDRNALQTPHQSSPVQTNLKDLNDHPSSHSAPTSDDSSAHVESGGDNYAGLLAAAAAKLSSIAGEPISVAQAGVVVDRILERGGNRVRNPRRYVLGTLAQHGPEWVAFIIEGKEPE